MPVFGMNNGMVPILGYNYGARKPKRMLATIKLATAYATGIMLVGVVIVQLFTAQLLGIFDASDALLAIGVPGLRIICLSFTFAGISVVGSSVFQALGHGFLSLWVSVIRQLVVLLPVAWAIAPFHRPAGTGVAGLPHRRTGGSHPEQPVPHQGVPAGHQAHDEQRLTFRFRPSRPIRPLQTGILPKFCIAAFSAVFPRKMPCPELPWGIFCAIL